MLMGDDGEEPWSAERGGLAGGDCEYFLYLLSLGTGGDVRDDEPRGDNAGETGNSDEFEFAMLTIVAVSSETEKVVVVVEGDDEEEVLGLRGNINP
jgi:hypothetical protein